MASAWTKNKINSTSAIKTMIRVSFFSSSFMDAIKLANVGSKYDCDSRLTVGTPSTIDAVKKKKTMQEKIKEKC